MKEVNPKVQMIAPNDYQPLAQEIFNFIKNKYNKEPQVREYGIIISALRCVETSISEVLKQKGITLENKRMPTQQ